VNPSAPAPDYILGLDLGQAQDYTALAVLERTRLPDPARLPETVSHYAVRHLKRWQLGTPYTHIVAELGGLVRQPPLDHPLLVVDQTGVGAPVVDMVRQARLPASLRPVLITGGYAANCGGDGVYHVAKVQLASVLQVLLQSRRIKVAPLPERDVLTRELLAFQVKVTVSATETFEAWREREHDDLVLAVALAAWVGERWRPFEAPPVCGRQLVGGYHHGHHPRGNDGPDRNRSVLDNDQGRANRLYQRGIYGRGGQGGGAFIDPNQCDFGGGTS
jgi:hypothetical protein